MWDRVHLRWLGLSALACATVGAPAPAYAYRTLADIEGTPGPIVWHTLPSISMDSDSFPDGLRELVAVELEQATRVWNGVGCTSVLVAIDHSDTAAQIRLRYEPDWTAAGFDATAAGSTDIVLHSAADGSVELVGATIHLNGRVQWAPHGEADRNDERDIRTVLVHELGHALGLAHNCELGDPALECGEEHVGIVMHPVYGLGGATTLSPDDIDGICELYSDRSAPPPASCLQAADCFWGELCVEGTCRPDQLYGAACSERANCVTTYCIVDSSSPAGGICTRDCELHEDCPSGADCVPVRDVMSLRVCQPRGAQANCSAAPGAGRAQLFALLIVTAVLVSVRRVGWRS